MRSSRKSTRRCFREPMSSRQVTGSCCRWPGAATRSALQPGSRRLVIRASGPEIGRGRRGRAGGGIRPISVGRMPGNDWRVPEPATSCWPGGTAGQDPWETRIVPNAHFPHRRKSWRPPVPRLAIDRVRARTRDPAGFVARHDALRRLRKAPQAARAAADPSPARPAEDHARPHVDRTSAGAERLDHLRRGSSSRRATSCSRSVVQRGHVNRKEAPPGRSVRPGA